MDDSPLEPGTHLTLRIFSAPCTSAEPGDEHTHMNGELFLEEGMDAVELIKLAHDVIDRAMLAVATTNVITEPGALN